MKRIGALLAAGAIVTGAVVGLAEPAMASDYNRTVYFCNHANQTISIARVVDESGSLVSRGWYNIQNEQCQSLTGRFMRIKSSDHNWEFRGSYNTQFCVSDTAFGIYSPSGTASCRTAGGYMTSFSSVPAGSGVYNFTAGPAVD